MKKYAIGFIAGAILCTSIGVAAYALLAKDVSYSPENSNWQVGNVEDALNSLYISKTADNYSETETKIGTWIDGRPVYQKVIMTNQFTTKNKAWFTIADVSGLNIDKLIDTTILGAQNTSSLINAVIQVVNGNLQVYTDDYTMVGNGAIIKYIKPAN